MHSCFKQKEASNEPYHAEKDDESWVLPSFAEEGISTRIDQINSASSSAARQLRKLRHNELRKLKGELSSSEEEKEAQRRLNLLSRINRKTAEGNVIPAFVSFHPEAQVPVNKPESS